MFPLIVGVSSEGSNPMGSSQSQGLGDFTSNGKGLVILSPNFQVFTHLSDTPISLGPVMSVVPVPQDLGRFGFEGLFKGVKRL